MTLAASSADSVMHPGVLDLEARALFFPVRHHSPACARAIRQLIEQVRPTAVLIEGPSDFSERMEELLLPHELPIAIYSWVGAASGGARMRHGAFYPFCVYSPEWQALQAGDGVGAKVEFIDQSWRELAAANVNEHRYAEPELRGSPYVASLCEKLGAPDLDALWDRLFEIEDLPFATLWERLHHFCYALRVSDENTSLRDIHREAFMAERVREVLERTSGRVVVVTGGFHSFALYARLNDLPFDHNGAPEPEDIPLEWEEVGLALTPYSYERLDALQGYESGMPNPGFYERVWDVRNAPPGISIGRSVLAESVRALRKRKQSASSADLIAALTTAQALSTLRGHAEVWRRDLVDGIIGALIKDELSAGGTHPFLDALHEALRGQARGRLSEAAPVAPLVADLRRQLRQLELDFEDKARQIDLDLMQPSDLQKSRVLHQARVLRLRGFERTGGTNLVQRDDLSQVREAWKLKWSPEAHASVVEASIYGPTVKEASQACLLERVADAERDAEVAALVLLDAALMGQAELSEQAFARLDGLIRGESDLFRLAKALSHLLYLFRFDAVLGTTGLSGTGRLLKEAWECGLWLLETLGSPQGRDKDILNSVTVLLDVMERCERDLELSRDEFIGVLTRLAEGSGHAPLLRGAATGALWTMGAANEEAALGALPGFADPSRLGDFLTGLFALARETVQRHPDLLARIDALLLSFTDPDFLEALPSLRLAFSYFTPREKHHMARSLTQTWKGESGEEVQPLADLEVSVEVAGQAMELEARLRSTLEKYGLRPFHRLKEAA